MLLLFWAVCQPLDAGCTLQRFSRRKVNIGARLLAEGCQFVWSGARHKRAATDGVQSLGLLLLLLLLLLLQVKFTMSLHCN